MKNVLRVILFSVLVLSGCQNLVLPSGADQTATAETRGSYGATDKNLVLLQGFHWNSNTVASGWYNVLYNNSQRIKDTGFNLVWFPPPSKTADSQGYLPNQLNDFNSKYGTETQLKSAISSLSAKGVNAIADIVINHRTGTTGWADFTNPAWSTYTIVQNDEWVGTKSQNYDEGDGISAARDLDHKNPETQNGIKTWLLSKVKALGFKGWRYDMVKGYAPWSIGMYNDYTTPIFSVGEFWDDYSAQNIVNWIDGTNATASKRSAAFDFPYRRNLYNAVVNGHWNWLGTAGTATQSGVVGLWKEKAVTFLENHDTEEARNGAYAAPFPNGDATLRGYAILLTHPGTPSVYWPDVYDSGSAAELAIKRMISVRQNYGITNTSAIWINTASDGGFYAAYITGAFGEIAVKVGPGTWQPSGAKWTNPAGQLLYYGNNYAIWGSGGKLAGKVWP